MAQFDGDQDERMTEAGLLLTSCMEKFEKKRLDRDGFYTAVGKYLSKLPEGPVPIPVPRKKGQKASKKPKHTSPTPSETINDGREDSQERDSGDDVDKHGKANASAAGE